MVVTEFKKTLLNILKTYYYNLNTNNNVSIILVQSEMLFLK